MNEKVITTTINADGLTVTIIADTKAAANTAVTAKKLDKKTTSPDITDKSHGNKHYSDYN